MARVLLGLVAFLSCAFLRVVTGQDLQSPCPRLFVYEPKGPEPDRWYAILTLLSEDELNGVWARLIFDKPFLQLGAYWPGEIKTDDNKEYLLKNRKLKLKARTPHVVRFFVRYDPADTPPKFVGFRLNAKAICPEGVPEVAMTSTEPQLITSSILNETSSSVQTITRNNVPNMASSSQVACGTITVQARPLLTQGVPADKGAYPWHVAICDIQFSKLEYICGGSLLSKTHVITAAHCVTKQINNFPKASEDIEIYLGKYLLTDWSGPNIQTREVSKIMRHPRYNRPKTFANDLAVVRLKDPAVYTDYVRPICLWQDSENIEPLIGKPGVVVGWGLDEADNNPEKLSMTKLPVVSKEVCLYSDPYFFPRFAGAGTFCAGYGKTGTSVACPGDSGGAMVFPVKGSPEIWQLRGIVSLSYNDENERCQKDKYLIFTDVAKYLGFVNEALTL